MQCFLNKYYHKVVNFFLKLSVKDQSEKLFVLVVPESITNSNRDFYEDVYTILI